MCLYRVDSRQKCSVETNLLIILHVCPHTTREFLLIISCLNSAYCPAISNQVKSDLSGSKLPVESLFAAQTEDLSGEL